MKQYIYSFVAIFLLCSGSVWAQPQKIVPVQNVHMKDGTTITIPVEGGLMTETFGSKNEPIESDAAIGACDYSSYSLYDRDSQTYVTFYNVSFFIEKQGRGGGWYVETSADGETFTDQSGYDRVRPSTYLYYRTRKDFVSGVPQNSESSTDEAAKMYVVGPVSQVYLPTSWRFDYNDTLQISYDRELVASFEATYAEQLKIGAYESWNIEGYMWMYIRIHEEELKPNWTEKVYDDGVVRFLVFDEALMTKFYEWLCPYLKEQAKVCETPIVYSSDYIDYRVREESPYFSRADYHVCMNVDPRWEVPNNCYLAVSPAVAAANPKIGLTVSGLVEGQNYQVSLVVAPDTIPESEDYKPLPTIIRAAVYNSNTAKLTKNLENSEGSRNFELPCEKTTTIELDSFTAVSDEQVLVLSTSVTSGQINQTYTRNFRIAKVIFTRIDEETEE